MKRGLLKAAAATIAVGGCLPAAHAGFELDPSLQVALENTAQHGVRHASAQGASSSAAPSTAAAASAAVGAPIPATSASSKPLAVASDAWDTKLQGFAFDEPLRQALSHTIPAGGQLLVNGALPDKRVSWDGASADSRMLVARKMLADAGTVGRFEGNNLIVDGMPVSAPAAQAAAANSPAAQVPAPPPKEVWVIRQGYPILQELKGWAKRAGWSVVSRMPRDVIAPTSSAFSGDFETAASDVVRTLAENGALIHAQFFEGNHTLVIQGPGVTPQ